MNRDIDTAIIGGGVVGLRLAWLMAERGDRVAVFDDGRHAGSTANAGSLHVQMQSRFMRLYPEMVPPLEAALPLYVAAVEEWRGLSESLGVPIDFQQTGGLMVAETEEQLSFLAAKCERERAQGLASEMLDRGALDRRASYLGAAILGAEFCAHEGKINPLLANQALRGAAREAGAVFFDGTTINEVSSVEGAWRLTSGSATHSAARLVVAAGARSRQIAEALGIALPLRSEALHMNITGPTGPFIGHLVQHADRMITLKQLASGHVVIGGGWPAGVESIARPPHVLGGSLLGNVGLAGHIIPQISGLEIIRSWAGINPTADGLSVLGEAPGNPGLYFAIGGDAGYTLGPIVARLIADVIAGNKPEFDVSAYSVTRFAKK